MVENHLEGSDLQSVKTAWQFAGVRECAFICCVMRLKFSKKRVLYTHALKTGFFIYSFFSIHIPHTYTKLNIHRAY